MSPGSQSPQTGAHSSDKLLAQCEGENCVLSQVHGSYSLLSLWMGWRPGRHTVPGDGKPFVPAGNLVLMHPIMGQCAHPQNTPAVQSADISKFVDLYLWASEWPLYFFIE